MKSNKRKGLMLSMDLKLEGMTTETRNKKTMELDQMSSLEIVTIMNQEDINVTSAIEKCIPTIAEVVDLVVKSFQKGARLFYMGAGTSGRLGVLDAAECPPTFGVQASMVVGLIAGGEKAFLKAVEGAEDSKELGREDLIKNKLTKDDIVIGIAASGRTPYVIGGLEYANEVGAETVGVVCNINSEICKVDRKSVV